MGVNSGTIWKSAESGSQTGFESFRRIAQTAERGLFSAFFLGEGLRLREHLGRPHALDVAGRPDAQTALAAVTTHIGLVATQNTTYNDPAGLAHRLSSLDLISGGRAAWNIVTTDNAWTGANFRRGGYLDHADRYIHAEAFVETAKRIWDAWDDGGVDVKIMPASEFILAATPREALDKKAWVRSPQIGTQQAIAYLEQFWGRELKDFDPDGPLPAIDPVVEATSETRGSGFHGAKTRQLADQWRAEAKEKDLSASSSLPRPPAGTPPSPVPTRRWRTASWSTPAPPCGKPGPRQTRPDAGTRKPGGEPGRGRRRNSLDSGAGIEVEDLGSGVERGG